MGEFELIERYFRAPAEQLRQRRGDVPVGIGDDGALLQVPPGRQLVAVMDTVVEGRHFPVGFSAASIGHRALAVNLSDLAAMGAEPAWFLLALTMPRSDERFLEDLAQGMSALAQQHGIALVGGDTTAGPLSLTVQAMGLVEPDQALLRSGGRPGDLLFVSGTPGDAAAGLQIALGRSAGRGDESRRAALLQRFAYPEPRVALGRALRGVASSCIDVSDGLVADAARLARASGCGLRVDVEKLPVSAALQDFAGLDGAGNLVLSGGDDYELCFTVAPARLAALQLAVKDVKCRVTCIGELAPGSAIQVLRGGEVIDADLRGFDHFA